jgi:ABC-type branched-subunit amino acid transport system ATPase component
MNETNQNTDHSRLVLSRSRKLQRLLEESRAQIARGKVLSADEVFAHLEPRKKKTSKRS